MNQATSPATTFARAPLVIPDESYAHAWVDVLLGFHPDFISIAHSLFARLANWSSWSDCMAAASDNCDELYDVEKLETDQWIALVRHQRAVMVYEFGILPMYANVIAWNNPVGNKNLFSLEEVSSDVFIGIDRPSLEELNEEMDKLDASNRTMFWWEQEAAPRFTAFTRPEIYAGLFAHLGWAFEATGDADPDIPEDIPLNLIGHLSDPEMGEVPVYTAAFASDPALRYDQLLVNTMEIIIQIQGQRKNPIVLMQSYPLLKTFADYETGEDLDISMFGWLLIEEGFIHLALPSKPLPFADFFVDLVAACHRGTNSVIDHGFQTALRFEYMRRRKDPRVPEPDLHVQAVINPMGTGWGTVSFEPT